MIPIRITLVKCWWTTRDSRRKHNVLVHYVDVCATDLAGVVIWNLFIWDILWFISIKNHIICVPKWILFLKHRNRKVVGGKHNVLVHFVNVSAPDLAGVVIWNSFTWDFLWFITIEKSCYFCACNNSEMNFIPQPHGQKSSGRHTQCSSTLYWC